MKTICFAYHYEAVLSMSDQLRKKYKVTLFRFPDFMGARSISVIQYKADLWRAKCTPLSKEFWPKVPGHLIDQKAYFIARYRIKINGAWYKENGARYTMLTQQQIHSIMDQIEAQIVTPKNENTDA